MRGIMNTLSFKIKSIRQKKGRHYWRPYILICLVILGVTQDFQYLFTVLFFTEYLEIEGLVAVTTDDYVFRTWQQAMVDTTVAA